MAHRSAGRAAFNPAIIVDVLDAFGNVVTNEASIVTLSFASGSATLGGTLSVKATGGIARFGPLTLSKAGSYTLRASDGKLTAAISKTIMVK